MRRHGSRLRAVLSAMVHGRGRGLAGVRRSAGAVVRLVRPRAPQEGGIAGPAILAAAVRHAAAQGARLVRAAVGHGQPGLARAAEEIRYRPRELIALGLLAASVLGGFGVEAWRRRAPELLDAFEAEPPRLGFRTPAPRGRAARNWRTRPAAKATEPVPGRAAGGGAAGRARAAPAERDPDRDRALRPATSAPATSDRAPAPPAAPTRLGQGRAAREAEVSP